MSSKFKTFISKTKFENIIFNQEYCFKNIIKKKYMYTVINYNKLN